jgi:3-dehydroquinate synthase
VSDLAGFVASTWMRGVPLVICPTTLESAIDASIGGKTGINIPDGKNLVGAFHPARLVATDPTCLRTLEAREVSAGMGESIKHGLIDGEAFTAWQETHVDAIRSLDETILTELVERNARIKCDIVQRDPFELRGERMFLNFGHTIVHAIESCGDYRLRHGECVALGMVGACRLSRDLGMCDQALVDRTELLLRRFDLPTKIEESIETDQLIGCIRNDKKTKAKVPRFVLLEGIGKPVIHAGVPEDLLRTTIESLTH